MGNIITIVLGALIIGYGGYTLFKSIKKEIKGEGSCCSGCNGCSSSNNCEIK